MSPLAISEIHSDTRAGLGTAYENVPRSGPLQWLRVISNRSANQTGHAGITDARPARPSDRNVARFRQFKQTAEFRIPSESYRSTSRRMEDRRLLKATGAFLPRRNPASVICLVPVCAMSQITGRHTAGTILNCLATTIDASERHHRRGESLRSHDRPAPGKQRHRQYPLPSPFSWPAATSSRWDHSDALPYPRRPVLRH